MIKNEEIPKILFCAKCHVAVDRAVWWRLKVKGKDILRLKVSCHRRQITIDFRDNSYGQELFDTIVYFGIFGSEAETLLDKGDEEEKKSRAEMIYIESTPELNNLIEGGEEFFEALKNVDE